MGNRATLAIYGIKDRNQLEYPAYTHDHNLCLMQDGKVLQYLQLERFTRRKYDNRLDEFLEELIDRKLLNLPDEFDIVSVNAFVGSSFITKKGRIRFEAINNKTLGDGLDNAYAYYQNADWEGKEIAAFNCSHELAHIASCLPFFGNFKNNSLLIHFDGAASVSNFSAYHFKDGVIKLLEYGWDLKYLANFFNDNAFVFQILGARSGEHCSVPGKLMGYAALGNYDSRLEKWLRANGFFKEYWGNPAAILRSIQSEFGLGIDDFDNKNSFFQDVAATLQVIFERTLLNKINSLQDHIKADYLYYSGGCALNIVANTKLVQRDLFKDIFIPPCCNDSGLSMGGAALLEWKKGNCIAPHSPYLNNVGITSTNCQITDAAILRTAEIIMSGGIVGVCNGGGEAGPRALGNRSLIALPDSKEIAARMSMEIKKREWYRPVAPIMLSHIAQKVTGQPMHHLSKYMLLDFEISPEFSAYLNGVIHANNTARIQTIDEEKDNPFMFRLLNHLYEHHGVLALINTSFNSQGTPIIHNAETALESAARMNLNAVIVNNQFHKL